MSTTEQWGALGTPVDVITNTELSNLANNAAVTGATAYDNTTGPCFALLKFTCTMAVAATSNTNFVVWILKSDDGGSTYESGTAVYRAINAVRGISFGAPTDTTQLVSTPLIQLPPGKMKFMILNNATGQATKTDTTAAGSKLTITPVARQSV